MNYKNRISKSLEKTVLKDISPKEIAEIDDFLMRLEKVWLKWVKEHPNWKAQED